MKYPQAIQYITVGLTLVILFSSAAALFKRGILAQASRSSVTVQTVQQAGPGELVGEYTGSVILTAAYSGVFSDTQIMTKSVGLGSIDLALNLTQAGSEVRGTVIPTKTLVFPSDQNVHIAVQGTTDGMILSLTSEPFSTVMIPISNTFTITRQFTLQTAEVLDEGATLIGAYKETVWGFGPDPSTVVGTFRLQRPMPAEDIVLPEPPTDTPTPMIPTDTPVPPTDTPVALPIVTPQTSGMHAIYLPIVNR